MNVAVLTFPAQSVARKIPGQKKKKKLKEMQCLKGLTMVIEKDTLSKNGTSPLHMFYEGTAVLPH